MNGVLYCDGDVQVRHRPAADTRRHVVTFDHHHDHPTFDRLAFAEAFLADRGISATHVLTRTSAWYQYRGLDRAWSAVRRTTSGATDILAYGSSMGGYAAIRFADAVGATRVLALSPQYSIDPRVMRGERRWSRQASRLRFIPALNGPIRCSADVVLVHDPCGPDQAHTRRIMAETAVRAVAVRHGGHPVGSFLSEIGCLAPLVIDAIDGSVDHDTLHAACRAARSGSMNYLCALADAQPAARPRTALALAQRAVAIAPGNPAGLHFLAMQLRAAGRSEEAVRVYRDVLALDRSPAYLFMAATILLEAGRAGEALAVGRELVEGAPERADYHYLCFRAHLALRQTTAATTCLRSALSGDPTNGVYWRAWFRLARILV
ncbi:tetratricopeptide repeat protein [Sphingomonas montana]|uniref:tetratricopeptide repeat protein n=1 Tax=Sphingomonas montana TaxID=1843236 RepID=UPI00096C4241|nr:tetratricopeptide repeat protein [Sphingomonas montana]